MVNRRKKEKRPPLNLDPLKLKTDLALLRMGKLPWAIKKPNGRRPR